MKKRILITKLTGIFLLTCMGLSLKAQKIVISAVKDVEDVTLRQSKETFGAYTYWSQWNFGKSQILDIGYATSVWNEYYGVTLIRFNLSGIASGAIKSAKFRIYKPKCITQITKKIPIYLHEIEPANADWRAGEMESMPQKNASSWKLKINDKAWAGAEGCAKPGIDFAEKPIATAIADREEGEWLEFEIPAKLVQRWIDRPQTNAGLLLKTADNVRFGEHVQFTSSEHYLGKGPQLVVDGRELIAKPNSIAISNNKRYQLPSLSDPGYLKWLNDETFRYADWSRDTKNLKLSEQNKIFPYLWDVMIDGEFILPYSYVTLTNNMTLLDKYVAAKDTAACKRVMMKNQNAWHVWEYVKEQNWYEAGNVVDQILTTKQMAFLFANRIKKENGSYSGIWSVYDKNGNWDKKTPEALTANIKAQTEKFVAMSGITPAGLKKVAPRLRDYIISENQAMDSVKTALDEVYRLLDTGKDSPALFDAMCRMGVYHDRMLFFQSIFGLPRLKLRYEAGGDPVAIAASWVKLKYGEYRMDRIKKRAEVCRIYWPATADTRMPELKFIDQPTQK
ncbi:DNRLRE domain-containing protein [Mucilaginibacter sp.]|uniref:DNRLRE domain-containing protein n=1 Tax=Mucilaginibacter sp. TaxID=1882438 RepID=UPI002632FD0F|nr:DNRLRE domain-containing protein [Mucilaginibacter sp.]MDB4923069.1 hypothetical protein [Mucilaginibacter sp.]